MKQCCDFGEFECDVHVGDNIYVDKCIADIVKALNNAEIRTKASCCGHGKILGSIVLEDGRELIVRMDRMLMLKSRSDENLRLKYGEVF